MFYLDKIGHDELIGYFDKLGVEITQNEACLKGCKEKLETQDSLPTKQRTCRRPDRRGCVVSDQANNRGDYVKH